MASKTTKPTGLKIERNKLKFTASWSLGKGVKDHSDGQRLYKKFSITEAYTYGAGNVSRDVWYSDAEVSDKAIGVSLRKQVISINANEYYPNAKKKISGITIKVKGNQKSYTKKGKTINPTWSDWAEKSIVIHPPKTPTVEQKPAPLAQGVTNQAVYKFNAKDVSDTNLYPFSRMEWESILVENTSTTDGSKLTWNANVTGYRRGTTASTSYEVPIGAEAVSPDKNTSWTRFVRVRAQGIGGDSGWAYNYHTYSITATPVITDETQPEQTGDGDIVINTSGSTSGSASHPIDTNMFRYAIGVPRAGLLPPLNPSWTEMITTADFRGTDNIYYEVDAKLEDDQCMWVSLGSKHDEQTSWSTPKLTHIGWLKDPTGLSVQTNWTSRKATITANNASSVEDSRLVVVFAGGTNENIVGVSDVGGGNKTITVDIPKYATEGKIAFGVYAAVGDYSNNIFKPYGDKSEITESFGAVTYFQTSERIKSVKSLRVDGSEIIHNRAQYSWDIDGNVELFVTPSSSVGIVYEPRTTTTSPKPLMRSKNTLWQGGSVPQAPSNVNVQKTDVKGSVLVSWEWSWEDADSAQIAWSDNPLAWESTDEPNEYTITNLNPSHWYVSELETGKKWYFRVRLIQTNDDTQTYGAWSDMISIDLSSAPAKPVLQLSNYVITPDGMTKAYWQYVSTDDTPQLSASLCEATVTASGITYSEPIASTDTSRHIDLYAEDMGWQAGETHLLCVRTISGSGKPSDGWSDPVALQIAESITATITQDSLETQSIEVNPETHSGNPITFTNPDGVLEFAKLRVDLEPTQEGTGDPSPSNVRPIHGVGSVEVSDVGKNILDYDAWVEELSKPQSPAVRGTGVFEDGGITLTATDNDCYTHYVVGSYGLKIPVNVGEAITLSWESDSNKNGVNLIFPNGGTAGVVRADNAVAKSVSYTPTSGVTFITIRFGVSTAGETIHYKNIMIEKGSTATTYEPYQEPINIEQPLTTTLQPIASDDEPYLMRAMPYGDATNLTESLVGGTVAWNQLVENGNFENTSRWGTQGVSFSVANNKCTVTITNKEKHTSSCALRRSSMHFTQGHVYMLSAIGTPSKDTSLGFYFNGVPSVGTMASSGKKTPFNGIVKSASYSDTGFNVYVNRTNALNNGDTVIVEDVQIHDLTAMFGSTIADAIYAMEQATAGAGVAWFKKLFPKDYYAYDAGSLQSVNVSEHKTVGFNQLDDSVLEGITGITKTGDTWSGTAGSWVNLGSNNNDWAGIKYIEGHQYAFRADISVSSGVTAFYIKFFYTDGTFDRLYYKAGGYTGEILALSTAGKSLEYIGFDYGSGNSHVVTMKNICINLSWDGERDGEYEAYVKHSYALDSGLVLRGIPKLDANNNLYYDGDTYASDGTVTRKYGVVDLGTLNWNRNATNQYYAPLPTAGTQYTGNHICTKYTASARGAYDGNADKAISITGGNVWVRDTAYPSATGTEFKTAMSGVYLVYELATPTTETVSSFESNQLVSAGGTESYTDTRTVPIPVGHKSTYKTSHVYGGYVDLVSGELVVDRAYKKFDSSEPQTNIYSVTVGTNSTRVVFNSGGLPNVKVGSYLSFESNTFNYAYDSNPKIGEGAINNGCLLIGVPTAVTTKAESVSYLAEIGAEFVYPLATPIRTTLTSRELSALVGRNTLTANGNMQIRLAEGITETECLTRLPLTVTVEGAGEGGVTTLAIKRDDDYHLDRPDDTELNGFEGEVIALKTVSGEQQFTVDTEDLRGNLDDDANYRIVAIAKDTYGQSDDVVKQFRVKWEHQPTMPEGTVQMVGDVAHITPSIVNGIEDGDHVDIYRLSADKPELIYSGAEFGETYVDPYPAIGGGYRLVYVTSNGDYKLDDTFAWVDIDNNFEHDKMILDWDGDRAELYYNVDNDDNWGKDFQATEYLGGSVVGDWNPAISRTADASAVVITLVEEDTVDAMRRLAEYAGAVHVRTVDGGSYTADVQVKRTRNHDHYGTRYGYSLKITRIDPIGTEAVPIDNYEVVES